MCTVPILHLHVFSSVNKINYKYILHLHVSSFVYKINYKYNLHLHVSSSVYKIKYKYNSTSTCFFFCVKNHIQIQFYIYMFHLMSAHYCSKLQMKIQLQLHTFPILHLHVFLSVYTFLKQPLHKCILHICKTKIIFNTNTQK